MEKRNNWKTTTIILVTFCLILAVIYYFQQVNVYSFGSISINKNTFNDMASRYDSSKPIQVCDMINYQCILLQSLGGK